MPHREHHARQAEPVALSSSVVLEQQFYVGKNPNFYCRRGPAFSEKACSNNKLCFAATDRTLLARHLLKLAQRDDCYFVKFSIDARAGLYLGRCFLTSDQAVGRVWAQYKCHPAFLCTVQNDDFVERFRDLSDHYDSLWLDPDHIAGEDGPWSTQPTGYRTP